MSGHPKFLAVLEEIKALHIKKSADYGTDEDALGNISASEELGIPAWKGAVLRMGDKWARIKTMCKKGVLQNESLEDSLIDMANYSMLALIKYRETKKSTDS